MIKKICSTLVIFTMLSSVALAGEYEYAYITEEDGVEASGEPEGDYALISAYDKIEKNEPEERYNEPEEHYVEPVLNVSVPMSIDFVLDPYELFGHGSLFSDAHKISNHGDNDVILTFTDITVTFSNDADFLALTQPFEYGTREPLKAIYMLLDFGRPDITPVLATSPDAHVPPILLSASGDELSFIELRVTGSINPNPDKLWENGDIKISVNYTFEAVKTQVSESSEPDIAEDELDDADGLDDADELNEQDEYDEQDELSDIRKPEETEDSEEADEPDEFHKTEEPDYMGEADEPDEPN